jgi:hypothetical protein
MTRPALLFCNSSHVDLREYTSIPEVGSSNNTNLGFPINAMAKHNFLFIPPDKDEDNTYIFSVNPTSLTTVLIASYKTPPFNPFIRPKNCKCSFTVNKGNNTFCCGLYKGELRERERKKERKKERMNERKKKERRKKEEGEEHRNEEREKEIIR